MPCPALLAAQTRLPLHLPASPPPVRSVKPCDRCKVTTIDQDTGEEGLEPLVTLREMRSGRALGWGAVPGFNGAGERGVGTGGALRSRKLPLMAPTTLHPSILLQSSSPPTSWHGSRGWCAWVTQCMWLTRGRSCRRCPTACASHRAVA